MSAEHLGLFAGYGIEIEYMVVDEQTLAVRPVADELMRREHGSVQEVVRGKIAWCNELALHLIELKTHGPQPQLAPLSEAFAQEVAQVNRKLKTLGARLMPTGMHPQMVPDRETQLWPHESREIYDAFDRIFSCKGHGWSNLQSTHLNLPFASDAEFGRLHAAVRLLLPLLPALTASSPVVEGRATGCLNNRLNYYRHNAIRIPSVSGQVVPEPAWTRKDYEMRILAKIYQDLSEHDPHGILQHEWVNARGAIARFDRQTIEIRLLDVQECPAQDIAQAALVAEVVRALVDEQLCSLAQQQAFSQAQLINIWRQTVAYAHEAKIEDAGYLRALGYSGAAPATAHQVWQQLIERVDRAAGGRGLALSQTLAPYLEGGPLGQRILKGLGRRVSRESIGEVYRRLCDCLADNRSYLP